MNSTIVATLVFALASVLPGGESPEQTIKTEKTDLDVIVEVQGTLRAARRHKLRVVPEEYAGPYGVSAIAASGRLVKAGAVLVELDKAPLERTIREAREAVTAAGLKIQLVTEELKNLKDANRLKNERMALDLNKSTRDHEAFRKYGERQLVEGKELALKRQENALADREQELEQLEKMYKDAQLASETKDIVLKRTRRNVELGRKSLELAREAARQLKEFGLPIQKEQLERAITQKKEDLAAFQTAAKLDEQKKAQELEAAERALRNAQERLGRLQRDLAQMTFKAPFDGVFCHSGIDVLDKAKPNTSFAELLDPSRYEVGFLLSLGDLQIAREGSAVKVRVPGLPDLELDGKIESIGWTATSEKDTPRYKVRAKLDHDKRLRPGARVNVILHGERLKKVIAIPRKAVFHENGRPTCRVRTEHGIEKRVIEVGQGNRTHVAVLSGLQANETVIVREAKK